MNFAKLIKRFRVEKARGFRLSDVDPADTCGLDFGKAAAKDILPMVCAILPLCRRSRPFVEPRQEASPLLLPGDAQMKRWKFSMDDVADSKLWGRYMEAYEDAIRNTATAHAPWYVVPGDYNGSPGSWSRRRSRMQWSASI